MTLLRNGLARVLFFIFLVICAVLVSLNVYLSGKLTELAPGYIDQFSKLSGFNIHMDGAGLDPLFRIRLDGVNVVDPAGPGNTLAEIWTLTIDPGVFSSLMSGRVTIREIIIDRPVISYSRGSADRVLDLIRGGEGEGKGASFEIKRIRLNDARIEIGPDTAFTSDALDIRITGKRPRNEYGVSVDGDIAVFGNGMDVSGTVNLKPGETSGRIKIVTDGSRPGSSSDSLVSSRNLKGVSEITFTAADKIDSHGEISVFSLDKESGVSGGALGSLKYELVYDKDKDTAHVTTLAFDIVNIISGVLTGDMTDITGGLGFDLRGSLTSGELTELSKRVPEIDPETVTGNIRSDNLRIDGSLGRNDIRLTGNVILDDIGFAFANESLRVSGLRCGMDVKQYLSGGSGFSFSSRGPCAAGEFVQKDIGIIKNLTAGVDISAGGLWKKKELLFSDLSGQYMDGAVSGSLRLSSGDGESGVSGSLKGAGLNLDKTPKSIAPFDLTGTAQSISADIEGNPGAYRAGIKFAINDFTVRSKTGREFKVSGARSAGPLDLEYLENTPAGGTEAERKIVIKDKGLSYENLSFGEYFIKGGRVDDLLFSLDLGGDWTLGMTSRGAGFQVLGMDVHMEEFKERIEIEESGRRGFSGSIVGTGGRFKNVTFPTISAEYIFGGDFIDIRKLSARVSSIGELRTDDFRVEFGAGKGGYPYTIKLNNGTFSGYEDKLKSEGISGTLVVNNPETGKTEWEGGASAEKTDIFSQVVDGLKLTVSPSPDGIIINDVSGKFMNGDLNGRLDIITSGPAARIVTDLGLSNASVKSGDLDITLGRADFDFSGTLPDDSLPEGAGKLGFDNLNMKRQGLDALYSGAVNVRTSGETLFIDDGFIRDKDNSELKFSGEMTNSLNGARRLAINIPDLDLKSAVKFLSPLMPVAVKEGQVAGTTSFNVEFNNLFDAGGSWNGSLSFMGASFAAYIGGADLSLRGINGTITVKDEGKGGNALASHMDGALTLDREIYKNYLRTFKESDPDAEADRINIEEMEYGILKFENVECALEADRGKLGILKLAAGIFGGKLYASGALDFDKAGGVYNFSFLFNDISLGAISTRLSPSQEYITGRVNGLVWLTGEGGDLGTIDGPFEFWSVSSDKEPRSIGKALLDKLGAKERLILGSSRSYDNGEISGYINDGVITFKKFIISNSILGIKNLSIQADPVKNSISIAHLVSVIREIARRSQSGGPTIETQ